MAASEGLVWHYTDGAGLLSIVGNHVLWATASGFLNDTDEVKLGYRRILAEFSARLDAGDPVATALRERLEASRETRGGPSPSSFFVLSAAQHWDLLAMWRLYGGPRESYAIGLDPTVALRVLADADAPAVTATADPHVIRQRTWDPVRYDPAEQQALTAAVFDGLEEDLTALKTRIAADGATPQAVLETMSETFDDLEQALVLIKHPGYHDEREIRHSTALLHPAELGGWRGVVRYRATSYGIAPHLWLTGSAGGERGAGSALTTTRAPLPIRSVAVSPTPNGDTAADSLRAMLGAHGYDVEVRRSSIPFRG